MWHQSTGLINDLSYLTALWESFEKIPKESITWILGDFNLSDFDWDTESPKTLANLKPCTRTS